MVDLGAHGYPKIGNYIKQSEHRSVLPPNLAVAAEEIRCRISEKPFDPPARKQIAPDLESRQVLHFLITQNEIVEVGAELVLSREAFSAMKAKVTEFLRQNVSATVSELRQALQTSRRVMVPFLEMLDTQKITRRVGEKHLLA